jgi:long-chain acyl-CoA synthetase
MCILPIHHVNGIVVTLVTPLLAGAGVVLNKGFKAGVFWKRLAEQRIAIVSLVPTILQFLCEAGQDTSGLDLAAFRYPICGAGTLPVALVQRFEKQFGFPVIHGYGLSETTAYVCNLPIDLSTEDRSRWLVRYGYPSIGVAFPHAEMAIHDPEGNALAAGARGEIVVRGHYVMSGYFHRPEANAETFRHGWFRSGDEGFFETAADGRRFFFITGRIKELINRGGVKYSPFEIEEILLQIPGVKVGLAIAFDNEWYGEEVGAYVVKEEGAAITGEEILAACRRAMPFAKAPKVVVFGTEVPLTVTGKYQRLKLKPLFAAHFKTQFRP